MLVERGAILANQMRQNKFNDWERVFVALEGDNIAGYCTFAAADCIPDVPYTPYVSFMFVGEEYRGDRLSEIQLLCDCIRKGAGFRQSVSCE